MTKEQLKSYFQGFSIILKGILETRIIVNDTLLLMPLGNSLIEVGAIINTNLITYFNRDIEFYDEYDLDRQIDLINDEMEDKIICLYKVIINLC